MSNLRIKNTSAELSTYSPALNQQLDRIFDEFGLITCGWSATWDPALVASIERCASRRYPMYWAARGARSSAADALIAHRQAQVLETDGADSFFTDLEAKVSALEDFSRPHPLSSAIAVAMVKRYIVDDAARIRLNDLVEDTLEDALARIPDDMLGGDRWDEDEFRRRVVGYEAALSTLLPVVCVGARWSKSAANHLWIRVVQRLFGAARGESGRTDALDFQRYLPALAFYAVGVGAVAGEQFELLKQLMDSSIGVGRTDGSISSLLNLYDIASSGAQKLLPGQSTKATPMSNHLATLLTTLLPRDVTAGDFEFTFDMFEMMVTLRHFEVSLDDQLPDPAQIYQAPVGRYIWRKKSIERLREQLAGQVQPAWMSSQIIGATPERAAALIDLLKGFAMHVHRRPY